MELDFDAFVKKIVAAFDNLTVLMKSDVGDAGALANAKQSAGILDTIHPDISRAYKHAIVVASLVEHVPSIPHVTRLVKSSK